MEQGTKAKRKKAKAVAVVAKPSPLSEADRKALEQFVYASLGNERLTWWEENFLNTIKRLAYQPRVFISKKQEVIVGQIKEKLHYDNPDDPLPPIDPDGIVENTDPDGLDIDADGYTVVRNDEQDDPDFSVFG